MQYFIIYCNCGYRILSLQFYEVVVDNKAISISSGFRFYLRLSHGAPWLRKYGNPSLPARHFGFVFDVILRPSLPTSDPPCKPDEMLHSRYGQPAFLFRKAFENFIGGRNSNFRKKPIQCLACLKRKLTKRRQKSCKENVTIR